MSQESLVPAEKVAAFRAAVLAKLTYAVGKDPEHAFDHDWFEAIALAARDHLVDQWMDHTRQVYRKGQKRVYYLSRNGGLGRLAACYLESMSTLGVAAHGYGIRYEHGLFRQQIVDGWQQEQTENWLEFGNPWEFERPEVNYPVGFCGAVTTQVDGQGAVRQTWEPGETVRAIAYDTPIVGWRGASVNTLRLWRARAEENLHLERFNAGDHVGAVAEVARAESISRVLYPTDSSAAGQELRLRQEYFFVSASLQDLLRRHLAQHGSLLTLPEQAAIQLNDTHPAIAVAELMRLLLDEHGLSWEQAWALTTGTLAYTNHTLLPEALETWPVALMERLLPRHMQIIYLINARHIDALRGQGIHDFGLLRAVSLIEEEQGRRVRMGNLAFLGCHSVNGVSALHTQLMRNTVFAELHRLYPTRINNKTNGITFRRWLYQANPRLTELLVDAGGVALLDAPQTRLRDIEPYADKASFCKRFAAQRRHNKEALVVLVRERLGIALDPDALFDVQVKRIHEYKRQLLNLLHTVALYQAMRTDPSTDWVPRVKIFAGKAAANYLQAKLIIKLTNDIARTVNADPTVRGLLKVVFIPNYNVTLAESIIPAADLSEQISTAGLEASGTSNMKFALNGALTIGTLDGANVEMREWVGDEHMFIFGLTARQVEARQRAGDLNAEAAIAASPRLSEALLAIRSGVFSPDEPTRYADLVDGLSGHDRFMVCADFDAYWDRQRLVDAHWSTPKQWWRSAVLNTARMGWFSADRAIREYATEIWRVMD